MKWLIWIDATPVLAGRSWQWDSPHLPAGSKVKQSQLKLNLITLRCNCTVQLHRWFCSAASGNKTNKSFPGMKQQSSSWLGATSGAHPPHLPLSLCHLSCIAHILAMLYQIQTSEHTSCLTHFRVLKFPMCAAELRGSWWSLCRRISGHPSRGASARWIYQSPDNRQLHKSRISSTTDAPERKERHLPTQVLQCVFLCCSSPHSVSVRAADGDAAPSVAFPKLRACPSNLHQLHDAS